MREHTDRRFDEELQSLRESMLVMGGIVEQQIARAIQALVERNSTLAREVIACDREVNRLDIEVDDTCLKLLARHQPAARDLRLVSTAMKINTDLERIGDEAVNICERAIELNEEPVLKPYIDLPRLAEVAREMVRASLDAYVRGDTQVAHHVIDRDDVVDQLTGQVFRELISFMIEDPSCITRAMRVILIAKYLERVADHATNITEMVIYLERGRMVRHMDHLPEDRGRGT